MSDKYIKKISSLMFDNKTEKEARNMDFIDIVCNITNGGETMKGINPDSLNAGEYFSRSRSNYFRVTDPNKLEELAKLTNSSVAEKDGRYALFYTGMRYDGAVDMYYSEEFDGWISIHSQVQEILADDEVAVFMEIGHERLRYLTGVAVAITTEAIEILDLVDIIENKYGITCFEV